MLRKLCEICKKDPCHFRCPNYSPQKSMYHCSSCGEIICKGEEYIENLNGEYRHYDCFHDIRDLLEWLGFDIRTMEEDYD